MTDCYFKVLTIMGFKKIRFGQSPPPPLHPHLPHLTSFSPQDLGHICLAKLEQKGTIKKEAMYQAKWEAK